MKVLFISLGCDKNRVDTEFMAGALPAGDYELTDDESEADVIIVNTCAFILDAKEESVETILDAAGHRRAGAARALIVCGCLAERYRDEIFKEIPEVDAVLGNYAACRMAEALRSVLRGEKYRYFADSEIAESVCGKGEIRPDVSTVSRREIHPDVLTVKGKRLLSTGGYYAHLKIADGCDKSCTYCIIPALRGSFHSIPMEDLLQQAEDLAAQGVRELILVAQETTLYGVDLYGEKMLPALLDKLNGIDGIRWIRLMYCYPEEIDDKLILAIIRNEKVCHYIDMPIQHINSEILKKMGRRTDGKSIRGIIEKIRDAIPDIAIRSTLICGFPGESDRQHRELLSFVDECEFDRLGAFTYSREEGTAAASFDGQVESRIKDQRYAELMELQAEVIFDKNEEMIGRRLSVMIEGRVSDESILDSECIDKIQDPEHEGGVRDTENGDECCGAEGKEDSRGRERIDLACGDVYAARSYRDAPDVDGYIFLRSGRMLMSGEFVDVIITCAHGYDLIGEMIEA